MAILKFNTSNIQSVISNERFSILLPPSKNV